MKKLIMLVIFSATCFFSFGQWIKLNGRQFIDENGKPFYPLCLDYGFEGVTPLNWSNPLNFYYAPHPHYDATTTGYDCTDAASCSTLVREHLIKVKDMGFNSIRIVNFSPKYHPTQYDLIPDPNIENKFYIHSWENDNGSALGPSHWVPFEVPGSTFPFYDSPNSVSAKFLDYLEEILIMCNDPAINLKVNIDVAPNGIFFSDNSTLPYNPNNAYEDYKKLLAATGNRLKTHTNLMSYIFVEEPGFNDPVYNMLPNKHAVCVRLSEWYDILKAADPNHLISIGGDIDARDVFKWDPGIMKMDFFQPHPYPVPQFYETQRQTVDRMITWFYWLSNNCPVPWMTGEISFSAKDGFFPPQVHGDESDQSDFAELTLDKSLDCNASGYTWWQYQEAGWTDTGRGYGLLKENGNASNAVEKAAVDYFRNYLDVNSQMPIKSAEPCDIPSNYYDPFNTAFYAAEFFPNSPTPPVEGMVTDDNAVPIKDAIIWAYVFTGIIIDNPDPTGDDWPKDTPINTYTNGNQTGNNYSIVSFDPYRLSDQVTQYIRRMEITAIGAETKYEGNFGWYGLPPYHLVYLHFDPPFSPPPIDDFNFSLQKISTSLNQTIQNQTINSVNSPIKFASRYQLTASLNNEIQSTGIADLTAMNEVNITDEFSSVYGSELHIYNSPLNTDCDLDFPTPPFRVANDLSSIDKDKALAIELIFQIDKYPITIHPNPNPGIFNVSIDKSLIGNYIKCYDSLGNIILTKISSQANTVIDLSHAPRGIYYLHIFDHTSFNSKIFIIQ